MVCPISFNALIVCFILFNWQEMAFECPIKAVVCQPPSKFGMFTFFVSYTMPFIFFFFFDWRANRIFGFLVREHNRNFQRKKGVNHPWMKLFCRGKEVLIKKVKGNTGLNWQSGWVVKLNVNPYIFFIVSGSKKSMKLPLGGSVVQNF